MRVMQQREIYPMPSMDQIWGAMIEDGLAGNAAVVKDGGNFGRSLLLC